VQRRHTTAAGKREVEAKKRKERDEKMAQAEGKEQGEEDGDGMIGKKNEGREAWTGFWREGGQGSDWCFLISILSQAPRCFACKAITSIQLPGTLPVRSAFHPFLPLSLPSSPTLASFLSPLGNAGLVPRLRGFYRTLFRAARRCGVERCEFWTQRVDDPVVEALEEMDNRYVCPYLHPFSPP